MILACAVGGVKRDRYDRVVMWSGGTLRPAGSNIEPPNITFRAALNDGRQAAACETEEGPWPRVFCSRCGKPFHCVRDGEAHITVRVCGCAPLCRTVAPQTSHRRTYVILMIPMKVSYTANSPPQRWNTWTLTCPYSQHVTLALIPYFEEFGGMLHKQLCRRKYNIST